MDIGLLIFALYLIMAFVAVGIVIAAYRVVKAQPSSKPQTAITVSRELENRLVRMIGDRGIALRLVDKLQRTFPGRPESWYWEKAIEDLDRDRR